MNDWHVEWEKAIKIADAEIARLEKRVEARAAEYHKSACTYQHELADAKRALEDHLAVCADKIVGGRADIVRDAKRATWERAIAIADHYSAWTDRLVEMSDELRRAQAADLGEEEGT